MKKFDKILEAAQRWGLDDNMQSRSFDDLVLLVATQFGTQKRRR